MGQMGLHPGGRRRLATAGPEGPGAGGQPAPRARLQRRQPGRGRQATAGPVPRRAALLRAVLARGVPAAGDSRRADRVRDAHQPGRGGGPVRQPEGRPGRGHRAAAHGQLRAGRGLGRGARGRLVHHRRRAAAAGIGVRGVRPVPREPGHGSPAADRRPQPVRDPRPAAARGRPGLPGQRPRPERHRRRGRDVRGEGADRRDRRPGGANRRRADAGRDLVRGAGLGRAHLPGDPGARVGHPGGEGRGDEPAASPGLRGRHRRAPGGLAHAPAGLHRRHYCPWGTTPRDPPAHGGAPRPPVPPWGRVMKIGMVCPYSWDVPGGVQQHIRDLAEALIDEGHEVSVISPADDDTPLPPYVVGAGRAVPVPYNGSVARLSFGFLSVSRVRRWLHQGGFDVLHVHEPEIPSLSLLACWVATGPIVATVHTAIPRSRILLVTYPVVRTGMEKINGRIAVSEAARTTLVEHIGGDAVVIPNGVATRRYRKADPLPGWPGPGGAIGFLGRLDEPRKGLAVLLKAFEILAPGRPGLRLLVAGRAADAEEVRHRVPADLRDRVALLGQVSEDDKIRVLHSVDVFCSPNTGGESFGIVTAEAMAAGVPIVASDIDAFQQVLRGGEAGELFATGDPADLARAAGQLLDDADRRAELSAAALAAVAQYDWSVVARDVLRVYATVMLGRTRVAVAPDISDFP